MQEKILQDNTDVMIKTLAKLVEIRSEKADPEPGKPFGPGPYEALEAFIEEAARLGFRTGRSDGYAAWLEFGPEDKDMVGAVCHLDVVPAQGWEDAYQFEVQDNRLIGRGCMDDKGPAVAVLYAMKELMDEVESGQRPNPASRIRLILGADEESGSQCMAHYVKHEEIPLAAFTADADFPVIHGEKGLLTFTLHYAGPAAEAKAGALAKVEAGTRSNVIPGEAVFSIYNEQLDLEKKEILGKMGHASMPQLAENAIQKGLVQCFEKNPDDPFLAEFMDIIGADYSGEKLGIAGADDLSGPLTSNLGIIHYEAQNGQGKGEFVINVRYPVTWAFDSIKEKLEEKLKGSHFSLESIYYTEPLYVPEEDSLVSILMDAYKRVTGRSEKPLVIGGGTYARSIPNTLAFGPCFPEDENLCHQKGEYITMETLCQAKAIYKEALWDLAQSYGNKE